MCAHALSYVLQFGTAKVEISDREGDCSQLADDQLNKVNICNCVFICSVFGALTRAQRTSKGILICFIIGKNATTKKSLCGVANLRKQRKFSGEERRNHRQFDYLI